MAVVVALAVLVLGGVLLLGPSSDTKRPIASGAARLVPADALVFVHLSTDTERDATALALRTARRFPGFDAAQRSILGRLSAPGCPVAIATLRKGAEAALALIDSGSGAAGSLILVDTGNDKRVRASQCGDLTTEKIGRFYVIGQPQTVQMARQLNRGKGASLAADPGYRRELAKLPAQRVADAWVSRDGVRRLLAPQSGLLGVAGALLDSPGLKDVAVALSPTADGARLSVRTLRTTQKKSDTFKPTLMSAAPGGSFAYLGAKGLSSSIGTLLSLVGPTTTALAPVLDAAAKDLKPLLDLFRGEVALSLIRRSPAPILTIVVKPPDIRKAGQILKDSEPAVARLLQGPGAGVKWTALAGGGSSFRPRKGVEIDYAVVRDLVVVSTSPQGIASVRNNAAPITKTGDWRKVIGTAPDRATSLLFLDFSQLLRLGEQTGLNSNKAYLAVKADLRKIKAVGAHTSSAGDESTAELDLLIP